MRINNARPRKANWVDQEILNQKSGHLVNTKNRIELDLNETSLLIWELCDGSRTTSELCKLLMDAYPEVKDVGDQVESSIKTFNDSGLIVFDGGDDALEFKGQVIRHISLNQETIDHLDYVREFLFTKLEVMEAEDLDADMENLLGREALESAKDKDADSAGSIRDSRVISYRKAMDLPSMSIHVDEIISGLGKALPEVKSQIEVSGHAIYLRGSHMGWHSNHSRSDGRIYCSWTELPNTNFFRYQHPITGEVLTEWELPGWNVKSFTIPPKPYRFWHCIGAESIRFSVGFRYNLPPDSTKPD